MKTSVIVTSVNRKPAMLRLFAQLAAQSLLPDQIVFIESGKESWSVSELPVNLQSALHYIAAPGASLAAARAIGQQAATGDLLFFFDDDILLPDHYIEKAAQYLAAHPSVMAVGGIYTDKTVQARSQASLWIGRLFGIYADGSRNRLLLSGWADYVRGAYAKAVTSAEWLFGCNFVVRANAFSSVHFETRMQAWSFLEDVFLGIALTNAFGDCMRLLPELAVTHDPPGSSGRISPATLRMRILYRYILWRDHIAPHRPFSVLRFYLGMAANLLLMLKQEGKPWVIGEHMASMVFILRNLTMSWETANEFIFA